VYRGTGLLHVYRCTEVLRGTGIQEQYRVRVVQVLYTCAGVQEKYRDTIGTRVVQAYTSSTEI